MEGDSDLLENESHEHDAELTRLIEECEYTDDEDENDLVDDYWTIVFFLSIHMWNWIMQSITVVIDYVFI